MEILDLTTKTWKFGPSMPVGLCQFQMVEHYAGGVVSIGGRSLDFPLGIDQIYHLASTDDSWVQLPQKLKRTRHENFAFLVPDTIANCSR